MRKLSDNPFYAEVNNSSVKKIFPDQEPKWEKTFKEKMDEFELELLEKLLESTKGRIKRASRISGVHRTTLVEKMRKFGLKKEDFR